MQLESTVRSTLRLAVAGALLSLVACGDNSPASPTGPLVTAREASSGGGVVASKSEIALVAPTGAPFRAAKGKARFSEKTGERELQIEAENIPAGTAVVFRLGATTVGTGVASALREVRLNLNSALGQAVPASVAGQTVTVTTAAGAVIVSGAF